MDFARVEGYLRSACSVLDFDVGELWQAEKIPGQGPTLNFVQIYTSPHYDRSLRSLLLKPEMSKYEDQTKAEELHQISPVICRSVCDGGQIVWANSNVPEGLVENSRVRLATAVGMPICSVGGNLCVIVLFATQPIPMTPNAIEFLCSMARAASGIENTSGFAKSPYSCSISPTHAKTDQFRGVWDISERLNSTYSSAIDFHLLPIERLQAFFDFQEVTSLNDICGKDSATHLLKPIEHAPFGFEDFSQMNARWTGRPATADTDDINWINANFQLPRVRTVSELPAAESQRDFSNYKSIELTADSLMMTGLDIDSGMNTRASANCSSPLNGSNSCCSSEIDEDEEIQDGSSLEFVFEDEGPRGSASPICLPSPRGFQRAVQIDARASFRSNQSRFHEFMDAILGLTLFDCAELWLLSDKTPELYIVTALHRDEAVQQWSANTKGMRLQKGVDVPGVVFQTCRPHWDKHYDTRHIRRAARKIKKEGSSQRDSGPNLSPRSDLASQMGLCTAFGVPLPGPSGAISGVLALYSRAKVEPDALLLTLVHKSVQLMSVSAAVNRPTLSRNTSGRGEAHFYQERPTISENPYSFFCPMESAMSPMKSSPDSTAFPFTDYVSAEKPIVTEDTYTLELPSFHPSELPGKRTWDRSHSIAIPGSCLYRTVSATELNVIPHPIFHSHSMDNMYLESSYRSVEDQRSKRARSIDLGNCSDNGFSGLGLPPTPVRSELMIPAGVEVYDHLGLQWKPFPKPYEMKKSASSGGFPYSHSEPFPYMMADSTKTDHIRAHVQHDVAHAEERSEVQQMIAFGAMSPFQYAMPSPVPSIPIQSALPAALVQAQNKFEASCDAFNADLAFSSEFTFDQDLSFNNYCSPDDSPSPATYPPCRVEGCEVDSSHRSPFCVVHAAGGRRCQQDGCNKCAQGSTCYCIAHGGGRRCTFPGCGKGARDKFFCAGHGGGKRCVSSDCTKSAVGGSKFCTGHGGGKRCKVDGCDKSAQSSTLHCVKHGGGRKCTVERCTKVARGKTDFCAAHGGGTRCRTAHCSKAAVGRYQYCRPHYSAIHGSESAAKMLEEEDEYMNDDDEEIRCGDCSSSSVAA